MPLVPGKIALVTGAGAGIGRATALKFAEEGATVVVSDIDTDGGKETVALIRKSGGSASFVNADVSKADEAQAMVAHVVATHGRLDCACNNAGIVGKLAPMGEQTEESFDRVVAVNLRGVFLCLRAEIAEMLKTGGGGIVNLSSVAGLIGFAGLSPYVASKHGINGLTKNAALEYAKQGIRVNSICPGGIDTRMLDSLAEQATGGSAEASDMMAPLHPMGRIGTGDEVANLIVWLCSPRASFVTGAHIPIDGGYIAQ
jgi:NAD(P)-dependent dehydrogenase (short-subunit alcohol dehydrogenase family)